MPADKYSFEGLDPIERRIMRLAPDIGYVILLDRTDYENEDKLGRLDLTEDATEPWREEAPTVDTAAWSGLRGVAGGGGDRDGDEEEPSDPYEEEDEPEDEPEEAAEPREPLPMSVLAESSCRWIRDVAVGNTVGEQFRRFRVKVFAPKGHRMLFSSQFVCRNHGVDLDLGPVDDLPKLEMPKPSFEESEAAASAKGIRALGDYYAQWGHIVLGSVGQLQGVNNSMLGRLHRQLQESRGQVDELVAAILNNRIDSAKIEDERAAEERTGDARTALAKEALNQLGSAANTFLTAKGVTPEMADLLGTLSSSPQLMAAMKKPGVQQLMQDPDNLAGLAAMLEQAAAQAQAQGDAPPPSSQPGSPETTAPAAG